MLEEEISRKRSRKQQEEEPFSWKKEIISWIPVSYTHLDVYKRQGLGRRGG